MKYIVYKTTNLINNYIYIGVHKTVDPDLWDYYLGNGIDTRVPYTYEKAKTKFQQAVKEFGVRNFKRETLAIFDTAEEAYELEEILVNENFLARTDVYNMILGGRTNMSKGITIYQYDAKGNYISTYDSYESAAKSLNVQASSIRRAVIYKYRVNSTYFTTEKVERINISEYSTNIEQINYRYLKTGEFDCSFKSYNEAARASNSSPSNIAQAIILGYCVKNSYYFSTIKADTYDKARSLYIKTRPVHKYDSSGEYICSYTSQSLAEKENPYSNITKAIKFKSIDENSFMWALDKLPRYNASKHKRRKVALYDDNGNIIKIWDSARKCAAEVGSAV